MSSSWCITGSASFHDISQAGEGDPMHPTIPHFLCCMKVSICSCMVLTCCGGVLLACAKFATAACSNSQQSCTFMPLLI
eukprot:12229288-Ditylum_brightwellii.AAC.1